jgi:hypothetical protein
LTNISYSLFGISNLTVSSPSGFTGADLGKIILSSDVPNDIAPIGVVVLNSGFIGNAYEEEWKGKYERGEDGSIIYTTQFIEKEIEETTIRYEPREKIVLKLRSNTNDELEYYQEKLIEPIPIIEPVLKEYPVYDLSNNLIEYITKPKIKKILQSINVPLISSNFDPSLIYIPRSKRPEWNLVALLGQVYLKNGSRISSKWIKMKEMDNGYSYYLIR